MQDQFEAIGELRRCELKGSHAFVDYVHDQDAKRAIEKLDSTSISGFRMNVMWSKLSPNFNAASCGLCSCFAPGYRYAGRFADYCC